MFTHNSPEGFVPALKGVTRKTPVYGEKTLLGVFHLEQGSEIPLHAHPCEQTGYMVSGRMRFRIGEEVFEAAPGDTWCIPLNMQHGVEVLEDSVVVEVFSPVREDYLPG